MTVGKRIREARKLRNMTQKQLAEAAEVAVGTIQQYELGKREPRYEILQKLSRALNISISALCETRPIPIEEMTPTTVFASLDKSDKFEDYLKALGYEIISYYEFENSTDNSLVIDHNQKKLYVLDGPTYGMNLEQSIDIYVKFSINELVQMGEEISDTEGWIKKGSDS